MGGAVSGVAPVATGSASPSSVSSGGKSAPIAQNNYGSSFGSQQAVGMGGMPMASPVESAMAQFGGQQQNQQQNQQLQPGFNPFTQEAMGALRQDPTFAASGGGYDSQMRPVDGSGNLINQNANPMGLGQIMQGLQGGKSSGMGQGGYQTAPGYGQQPQQNTMLGLYSGPADQAASQQIQQQKQQGFGFGGAYGQQAQARQQGMFQRQQPQQASPYGGGYNPQAMSGLQSLFNQMMGQYSGMGTQQPQMQQPMPQYQSSALNYKPDYIRAQENLNRVKPSVQKQQEDAQAARIAELEAQLADYSSEEDTSSGFNSNDYAGG